MGEYGGVDAFTCEWCDLPFARPSAMGPPPKFCTASHRQRAYEVRRLEKVEVERDRLRAALQDALDMLRPLAGLVCDVDVLLVADLYRIITAALDERAEVTNG